MTYFSLNSSLRCFSRDPSTSIPFPSLYLLVEGIKGPETLPHIENTVLQDKYKSRSPIYKVTREEITTFRNRMCFLINYLAQKMTLFVLDTYLSQDTVCLCERKRSPIGFRSRRIKVPTLYGCFYIHYLKDYTHDPTIINK